MIIILFYFLNKTREIIIMYDVYYQLIWNDINNGKPQYSVSKILNKRTYLGKRKVSVK